HFAFADTALALSTGREGFADGVSPAVVCQAHVLHPSGEETATVRPEREVGEHPFFSELLEAGAPRVDDQLFAVAGSGPENDAVLRRVSGGLARLGKVDHVWVCGGRQSR